MIHRPIISMLGRHGGRLQRRRHTCTNANVQIAKVSAIYHQQDMKESQKDPFCTYRLYKGMAQDLGNDGRVHKKISRGRWKAPQLWIEGCFGDSSRKKVIPRTALMVANISHMMRKLLLVDQLLAAPQCL